MEKPEAMTQEREANEAPIVDHEDLTPVDKIAEQALLRKLDRWIVPPVMLLYLFSFLDRVNIGNARLYGLEEDLGLVGNQYQLAVSILFVTYVLSEVPSNLVLKKFTPSRWLAFITTSWGIVATLTGIVQNFHGLIAVRLILGALEGGLFPGLAIYLTFFYTKRELALRVGYLFVSSAIAGSVGGLLAYAIGFMDGIAGLRGWRWIMIIEGIPTVFLGISIFWWLADDAESAYYLTAEERALLIGRLRRQVGVTSDSDKLHKKDAIAAFKDWKIWAFSFGQFGADVILYGYSTFLPTIIRGLGDWNIAQVQALTIPCYALGAISYLACAWWSDRKQQRTLFVVVMGLISAMGYVILISPAPSIAKYIGCCIVGLGLYVIVGIPLAWLPTNNPRYGKRTVATGLQVTIGNTAGVAAPFLYASGDAPRFVLGHSVSMAMLVFAAVIFGGMGYYFHKVNRRRDRGEEDHKTEGMTDEEIAELGEHNPGFRYTC